MFQLCGSSPPPGGSATEEMWQLSVDLQRQTDGLGIGLTLDNIIVEVEPGGSVAAQGDLKYGLLEGAHTKVPEVTVLPPRDNR